MDSIVVVGAGCVGGEGVAVGRAKIDSIVVVGVGGVGGEGVAGGVV